MAAFATRLRAMATHVVGFVILPAQLPGDPADLVQDLIASPWAALRDWEWSVGRAIIRQIWNYEKLTIPDDPQLERLHATRTKYLARGWAHCPLHTSDGLTLDAYWRQPKQQAGVAPRFIIFVGGNAQKYEDWLPYFHLYADESEMGFLCFNFRGVARSEGSVNCPEDMLVDVGAAVDHLVSSGVQPQHILLHGFSLGAAVAALFLARPGAPPAAITSDRSFRSFPHAAFAVVRGFAAANGDDPYTPRVAGANAGLDSRSTTLGWIKGWLRMFGRDLLVRFVRVMRALVAALAYEVLVATGWTLDALDAWDKIEGRKVGVAAHCTSAPHGPTTYDLHAYNHRCV